MPRSIGHNIKPLISNLSSAARLNLSDKPKMDSVECRILPEQKKWTGGWDDLNPRLQHLLPLSSCLLLLFTISIHTQLS